jgi:hypothetical protein
MIPISVVRTMVAISIVRAVIAITAVGVIRTMIAVVTAVVCAPIHSPVDARYTERREGATYSGFGGVKR